MSAIYDSCHILIVEDAPADLFLLEQMLLSASQHRWQVTAAATMREAVALLHQHEFSLVLLDLSLPDSFGLDTLKEMTRAAPSLPVVVLTGLADSEMVRQALHHKAQDYLVKGQYNEELLVRSVAYSIERKKVKERMRMSEEKYRQIFYQNPFPMWINDGNSLEILEVNEAAIRLYGYSRAEFLRLRLTDLMPDHEEVPGSGAAQQQWQHCKKDGSAMTVEMAYYAIPYHGRLAMQAQVNDITEKLNLQQELMEKKQQLVEAVLGAQEAERKKIGRELHDNINQTLTAVKLNLSMAAEPGPLQQALLDRSIHNIVLVMEEVRRLSKSLILPGSLRELGLVASLQDLFREKLQPHGVLWNIDALVPRQVEADEELKLAIYRIVELKTEFLLHCSSASKVRLLLESNENLIHLQLVDNGQLCGPEANGTGLEMTEIISRAEQFNGTVHLRRLPENGCILDVTLLTQKPATEWQTAAAPVL